METMRLYTYTSSAVQAEVGVATVSEQVPQLGSQRACTIILTFKIHTILHTRIEWYLVIPPGKVLLCWDRVQPLASLPPGADQGTLLEA